MEPGILEKLRAPGATWNLSFVFIYDFWKFKSHKKLEKEYFLKLNWQQNKFWCRNRWERNPKLQVLRTKHSRHSFPGFAAVSKSIMSVKSILWKCLAQCSEGSSYTFSPVPWKSARQIRFSSYGSRFIFVWQWNSLTFVCRKIIRVEVSQVKPSNYFWRLKKLVLPSS